MITATNTNSGALLKVQEKEIRALALQAACTLFANREIMGPSGCAGEVMKYARRFEDYIHENIITGEEL